jgi:peptidoglycan hydrolase-like protein with peptidoglycan-binding domain
LAERGYYLGPHDGLDGPATRRALRWFQTDAQLPRDDTIDSQLLQQIRDAPPDVTAEMRF